MNHVTSLLFNWPTKKGPRLVLPLCILLAAILHLSTIYLFHIVYQPPHVSKPVAAEALFLIPGSTQENQITAWLEANDSSIFSPLRVTERVRPTISSDIYIPHKPSLPLRPLPSLNKETISPPLLPTKETVFPATPFLLSNNAVAIDPEKESSPPQKTRVHLLEQLASRKPLSSTPLGCPEIPKGIMTPLSPTELTVNITSSGIPQHVSILQSSGNTLADEAATHWLMSRRFAPASQETWGNLLILWGVENHSE